MFTLPLPQLHRIGSEPIYLQCRCHSHSHSSVNASMSYSGIQLLTLRVTATVAAPCEGTFIRKKNRVPVNVDRASTFCRPMCQISSSVCRPIPDSYSCLFTFRGITHLTKKAGIVGLFRFTRSDLFINAHLL